MLAHFSCGLVGCCFLNCGVRGIGPGGILLLRDRLVQTGGGIVSRLSNDALPVGEWGLVLSDWLERGQRQNDQQGNQQPASNSPEELLLRFLSSLLA